MKLTIPRLLATVTAGLVLCSCATRIGNLAGNSGLSAEVYPVMLVPQGATGVLKVDTPNKGCTSNPHNGCMRFDQNVVGLMKFYLPGSKKTAKSCSSGARNVITQIDITATGSGEKGDFTVLPLPAWVKSEAFPLVDLNTGHAYLKTNVNDGSTLVWLLNANANNPASGSRTFWYRVTARSCATGSTATWVTDPRGENEGTTR